MNEAMGPWPDSATLQLLAAASCHAYEELWLVWLPALRIEGMVREKGPEAATPQATDDPTAHPKPIAKRQTFVLLGNEIFDTPVLVHTPDAAWPLRPAAISAQQALAWFREGLRNRQDSLATRWIQPLNSLGHLLPEALILVLPISVVALFSIGPRPTFYLLRPDSWTPTMAPQMVSRESVAPLLSRLHNPSAQAWAKAWNEQKQVLGIHAVLNSPYQLTADGPCLPIRLSSGEQGRFLSYWILAGEGACRALARVTPLA